MFIELETTGRATVHINTDHIVALTGSSKGANPNNKNPITTVEMVNGNHHTVPGFVEDNAVDIIGVPTAKAKRK